MLNITREIGLMYSTVTRELGVLVAAGLKKQTGIDVPDLCVGLGDVEEVEYNAEPAYIHTQTRFNDTHLTHIVVRCDEIPALNIPVAVDVDMVMGQHYDNVLLALELLEACENFRTK